MKIRNVRSLHTALRTYTKKLRVVVSRAEYTFIPNSNDIFIYKCVAYKNVQVYFITRCTATRGMSYLDMYSPGSMFYRDNIFWSLLHTIDTYKFVYGLYKE